MKIFFNVQTQIQGASLRSETRAESKTSTAKTSTACNYRKQCESFLESLNISG